MPIFNIISYYQCFDFNFTIDFFNKVQNIFIKIFRSKIIFAGILFFLFFSAQQIVYTGCFLIPNNLTCITNLSWFDPNIIENFITDTTKVNKSFQSYEGDLTREEYLANFNWVKNWYLRNKIELFEHVGTFLALIIVYIFFLAKIQRVIKYLTHKITLFYYLF